MPRKGQEDWGPGVGEDPDKPRPVPGSAVARLRSSFTEMFKSLDAPLWSSVGKMVGNIKWLLDNGYDEATVLASFQIFQGQTHAIAWNGQAVWDEYYKRKAQLLRQVADFKIGGRGEGVGSARRAAQRAKERTERDSDDRGVPGPQASQGRHPG